ncbi:MAG: tetratricopeptide repeat protein [Terrimicrobiaceae bacterium]
MSNSSMESPIPSAPVGTTFKVAAGLLTAFLVLQIAAVAWFYLPRLQEAIVSRAVAQKPAEIPTPAPVAAATPVPQPTAAPTPQEPDEATYEKITTLVAESDKAFRIGEYDQGLEKIREADRLLPNDAGILLRIGRLHEKRGETTDAAAVYNTVLALPDLSQELRIQTRRKLGMLESAKAEPAAPSMIAAEKGADARDEFGLQPGAILGIVDTRLSDGENGKKTLRISIKSRPGESIDTTQMRVHVYFYDKDSAGNIELTDGKIVTEWISPPVNWSENEPELLDATYTVSGEQGFEFVGYVVGIYYAGELQDTRANPGSLATNHPLPLYLPRENQ